MTQEEIYFAQDKVMDILEYTKIDLQVVTL